MFQFHDPGQLIDDDLRLVLDEITPGDPQLELVPAYHFTMVVGHQEAGHINLRIGDIPRIVLYGGHIGYNVDSAFRGQHYAARSCRLLLPLARKHDLKTIWITCNPDNLASCRTCELAGARFVEIVDLPSESDMYERGERQKCRYRLDL